MNHRLPTTLALSLLFVWTLPAGAAKAHKPDFTGIWQLNQELSEDPREKMMEARQRGGGGRGFGGGGGGFGRGGGGRGGGGGGGRGGGRGGGDREAIQGRFTAQMTLNIDHDELALTITDADGRERDLVLNGEKYHLVPDDDRAVTVKTSWKGDKIVIKTSGGRGDLTETYELSDTGTQLYVTTKMKSEGPMGSLSFKRVYDAVEQAGSN